VRKIADVYSDTDGIPDWWRLAWFGHPLGQASDKSRGSDDPDGDGMNNLAEFLAGTQPLNTASVFKITQARLSGADVLVNCLTVTNRVYQLQRADTLGNGVAWSNTGSQLSGTPGVLVLTDSGGATNGPHFYRVVAH
jgi:hypothetical protein